MSNPQGDDAIRILLVDDIAETRESIKKLLAFEGDFKVVGSAGNGREGVELARDLQPDIVIMDINMPDMDGLEAANRITKAVPTVGVIMMSVQDDSDYIQKAMMAGARSFLSKPVNMDQLYSTIRNVYNQYTPIRDRMNRIRDETILSIEEEDREQKAGDRAGHIIAVYSPQGGVGCTTIATNLASGLMKEGVKTLLVDCSLEFGDVGAFLDLRPQSTLTDLVDSASDIDLEFFESVVMTHNSGMKVLLGPSRPAFGTEIRDTQPGAVATILEQIANYYDFIVIDTSHSIDAVIASVLEMAHKIVLVTVPTLPCIKNTKLVLDLFDETGFPPDKTSLVINKAIENPSRSQKAIPTPEKIQNYLKRPVEGLVPVVEETFILNAINKGVPVIASDRDNNKPPIKQLLRYADHLYASMMGIEELPEDEPENEGRSWTRIFGR
jgi:pilus assembly protein CpaE